MIPPIELQKIDSVAYRTDQNFFFGQQVLIRSDESLSTLWIVAETRNF
jgi:hypothetical protein